MSKLVSHTLDIDGVATRILRGGKGPRSIVFLHGGIPGITPYAGGSHLWGTTLDRFAAAADVIAIDLLGSGATAYPFDRALTIDDINNHVEATLEALDLKSYHVIGHDLGGLTALWLGMQERTRVSSVGVVASSFSTAIGEDCDDLTLSDPPLPLFSRDSQRWAFDRLSANTVHIDAELLDAAVKAAQSADVARAVAAMSTPEARADFLASHAMVRGKMWAQAREAGYPVPVQIIWGAQDPLASVELGQILFVALGKKQRITQFHLLNEAGSFVFREQPARFEQIVTAFLDGVAAARVAANT